MTKHQIQFPRYKINKHKPQALADLKAYIGEHLAEFIDGEEIALKYIDEKDNYSSVNIIVHKDGNTVTLSPMLSEQDTLKIIEKDGLEPPEDAHSLWLSDRLDKDTHRDFDKELTAVKIQMAEMSHKLDLLIAAVNGTLGTNSNVNDLISDSQRYALAGEYDKEKPENSKYNPKYAEDDKVVDHFKVFIGDMSITDCIEQGIPFYSKQKYFLILRLYNISDELVEETTGSTVTFSTSDISIATVENRMLFAEKTGNITLKCIVETEEGNVLTDTWPIEFLENEKPDYEIYYPKHILVKNSKTFSELTDRQGFVAVSEFVWCIEDSTLYLKALQKDGKTPALYKINGTGSVTPTGETGYTRYYVDAEENLYVDTDTTVSGETEDNYLILDGYVDAEGYLVLNDTGGGGNEPIIKVEGDELIVENVDNVDEEGFLSLPSARIEDDIIIV